MEATEYFTCIAYDSVDFLIQSKYMVFGMYLDVAKNVRNIAFNEEILPHIHIGALLEKEFSCKSKENCGVILVMRMRDFAKDVRTLIATYTQTPFPASGNFAISVNSAISSRQVDISSLRLIPKSIRTAQTKCGVAAIGFLADEKDNRLMRKQILLSLDNLLRTFFSAGLINKNRGEKK